MNIHEYGYWIDIISYNIDQYKHWPLSRLEEFISWGQLDTITCYYHNKPYSEIWCTINPKVFRDAIKIVGRPHIFFTSLLLDGGYHICYF